MNDPTHTPPHDPRRLTGVPEIDGTAPTQIIVDGHELTVDQAKAPEPFKLTTQVGTVDLVLLDNEGEPHKIGEAEVVQGHITAHIDDDDAVRYLSGGTITLDRLDLLAEHSYPVEPILVHAPEGQIRVGHTCDMPGGLQITITDRAMRGPMMAALAEIKTAALEGRAPLEHNVAGGFTPRTEVSEVGPATFDSAPASVQEQRARPATGVTHCMRDRRPDGDQAGCSGPGDCTCACMDCVVGRQHQRVADDRRTRAGAGLRRGPGEVGFSWVDETSHVSGPRLLLGVADRDLEKGDTVYLPITHKHEPVGPRLDIGPGPHQIGRRLMTVDDFRTPEEFKIYCAGADRLPQGILPGSWEGHLLTAMAAMVAAGVGLHEARMEAPPPNNLSQLLSDAGDRGRRLWAQGGSTEAIREYICEAANLLDAAAEKYAILVGLQRGAEKRVEVKRAEADKALDDRHRMREVLLSARGGDAGHMAKAITRALGLIGGGSVEPPPPQGLTPEQAANVANLARATLEELYKRAVKAEIISPTSPPWGSFEEAIKGISECRKEAGRARVNRDVELTRARDALRRGDKAQSILERETCTPLPPAECLACAERRQHESQRESLDRAQEELAKAELERLKAGILRARNILDGSPTASTITDASAVLWGVS